MGLLYPKKRWKTKDGDIYLPEPYSGYRMIRDSELSLWEAALGQHLSKSDVALCCPICAAEPMTFLWNVAGRRSVRASGSMWCHHCKTYYGPLRVPAPDWMLDVVNGVTDGPENTTVRLVPYIGLVKPIP